MTRRGMRVVLAALAIAGLQPTLWNPVRAEAPQSQTDSRFLSIAQSACGAPSPTSPPARPSASPATVAQVQSSPSPAPPSGEPSPAPSPSVAPSAVPDQNAPPLPPPFPTPSPLGIPPALPGPGQIVPPTPFQPPAASPPALPTATPSGPPPPVFLVRPSSTPFIPPVRSSATPLPSPSAAGPTALPTLGPDQIATISDRISGSTENGKPSDLDGNVHIYYIDGQIVGDHAHYDGQHTMTITGHTYLINRYQDSILYADSIQFATDTHKATLVRGRGETTEGVQVGKLHYTAQQLVTASSGVSHGDRASFTTCENPHGGYHVESRTLDLYPGDKIVARKAVVFLGPLAIFYLPLLVIPLRDVQNPQRNTSFLPIIGYSQLQGFYIKLRIGFAPSNTYYGYYRVEYYTKEGLGLGYTAYIGSKNNRRTLTVDSYTIDDRIQDARETNLTMTETENFSSRLRSQVNLNYTGDYGAGITIPASLNLNASIIHQGNFSTENLTFSRFEQGSLSDNLTFGYLDTLQFSQYLQQQINLSYSKYNSDEGGTDTFHINTVTHWFTKLADLNVTYDQTDYSAEPFGYNTVPELQILPHINFGDYRFPFQTQFTIGQYTEPENHFTTGRAEFDFDQPIFLKVLNTSDFNASFDLKQDWYATGDEKAFIMQNASLSTPIGNHIVNAITYNEQNPIGPSDVPFQILDHLSSGSHGAADVLRLFNSDIYSLSLSDGTNFNEEAQPVQYQLSMRPSTRSVLVIGGFWSPGPGNGFGITNVQAYTPFGRDTTLEFTTNVDWKNKGRLEDKNIDLIKTIGNCYSLNLSYNQDLKEFTFNINLLAFPNQGIGTGFGGPTSSPASILPQNFAY